MYIVTKGFLLDMKILLCLTALFLEQDLAVLKMVWNIETVPGKKKIRNHSRSWTQNVMAILGA